LSDPDIATVLNSNNACMQDVGRDGWDVKPSSIVLHSSCNCLFYIVFVCTSCQC